MTVEQRLEQLEKRNKRLTVALAMAVVTMATGCTPPVNIYQKWGTTIESWINTEALRGVWYEKADVSFLLGQPPSDCDPITYKGAQLGIWWDLKAGTLSRVLPDGPADEAEKGQAPELELAEA